MLPLKRLQNLVAAVSTPNEFYRAINMAVAARDGSVAGLIFHRTKGDYVVWCPVKVYVGGWGGGFVCGCSYELLYSSE